MWQLVQAELPHLTSPLGSPTTPTSRQLQHRLRLGCRATQHRQARRGAAAPDRGVRGRTRRGVHDEALESGKDGRVAGLQVVQFTGRRRDVQLP